MPSMLMYLIGRLVLNSVFVIRDDDSHGHFARPIICQVATSSNFYKETLL